jgi:NADPH-dependent 2,4-dienoyl-CoA reductase/sulfur reductase-like enzyme/rhodanese-related sulfurtransferase
MKIVIVGGVAGGAAAAARVKRLNENAQIVMFERGPYISFANCGLPYYIGGEIKERDDLLVSTPEKLKARYEIDVRINTEVTKIIPGKKEVSAKNLETGKEYTESYDKLILSPGASPVKPPLPGIDLDNIFTLRNVPDTDKIKSYIDDNKINSAVVVGGGFIGLEMAENLSHLGIKVSVVEMLDQVMAPIDFEMAAIVHEHLIEKGIDLRLSDGVKSFEKNEGNIIVHTNGGSDIDCQMVVLSIGVRPENELAKNAGLEIGKFGGIVTDDTMRTTDPDIFAVGDAVETRDFVYCADCVVPLAGPAAKQGRIAADNALGRASVYKGTQGTSIVKIFDLVTAATGMSEKRIKLAGLPYLTAYLHANQHVDYYPGAERMSIKLLFSPGNGSILGAQIVGKDGVDRRIDVLATAIRASMTVFDLEELELAYAPPYGAAKDAINMAGFVASNMLKKDVVTINWDEISDLDESHVLLDIRDADELEDVPALDNAVHIPLCELRGKLEDLDKNKTYIPYCAIGLRGYLAYRILVQNGFKTKNLAGGTATVRPTLG